MTVNRPSVSPHLFESLSLRSDATLLNRLLAYLDSNRTLLHRYPEEEYTELRQTLAQLCGWPKDSVLLAKTAAEALEFSLETLLVPGAVVWCDSQHPYRDVLQRQTELRGGQFLTWEEAPLAAAPTAPTLAFATDSPPQWLLSVLGPLETPLVLHNALGVTEHPRALYWFEWPADRVTANPLGPAFGVCTDPLWSETLQKIQEPFHIPTQLLVLMHAAATANPQGFPHWPLPQPALKTALAVPDAIASIQPYVPGKGIKRMSKELGMPTSAFSKLASNEHPFGVPDSAFEALKTLLTQWDQQLPTYEAVSRQLKEMILASVGNPAGVTPDQVLLGTGSVELIKTLIKVFVPVGGLVMFPAMPFAMYPYEAKKRMARIAPIPLTNDLQVDIPAFCQAIREQKPQVIFLANPRNPLGTGLTDLTAIVEALDDQQVLVVDEAYVDFIRQEMGVDRYPDGIQLLLNRPDKRILSLRTFSKGHALASFRLGFSISSVPLAEALNTSMLPCAVDPLTMAAAIASLGDPASQKGIESLVEFVIQEKETFYQFLGELGLRYVRSYGNFIYFETGPNHTSQSLFDALVRQGVIIRPVLERSARVNVGTAEENQHFIRAMRQAFDKA